MDKELPQLHDAISTAKSAAAKAGVDLSGRRRDRNDPETQAKTSFSFVLEHLPPASSISEVEQAVNAIEHVDVRIVYPKAMAWVTASQVVDPTVIVKKFREFGIEAKLTDSSLRRRLAWSDVEEGRQQRAQRRRRTGLPAKLRKQLQDELRSQELARRSGFMHEPSQEEDSEVLFTARSMITWRRFLVAVLFSIPVMVMNLFPERQFDYWQWMLLAVSTPVVFYGAWPFHRATLGGARRNTSALDAASSVAILLAWIWSAVVIIFTPVGDPSFRAETQWVAIDPLIYENGALFFDVACGMTVMLLGGRLLTRTTRSSYLDELARFRPDPNLKVTVVRKKRKTGEVSKQETEVHKLNVGEDIVVAPYELIPVDGAVIGGSSEIDASALGISPFVAKVKSTVYAGCINGAKPLKIRVLHTGHRTWIAAIYRWVENAAQHQDFADAKATRAASILVPISLIVAAFNFAIWALMTANLYQAFATSLAVLGCVAPVALAVSASIATRQGIEAAARRGVLIREGENIRQLDTIESVVFNRVGTLSEGEMIVETVTADRGEDPDLVLRVAGAISLDSDHPVSQALVRAARESRDQNDSIPRIEASHFSIDEHGDFHSKVEIPIDGEMRSVDAMLWRPRNLSQLEGRLAAAAVSGGTPLVVRWKNKDRGVITLHDHAKDDATEAVDALENLGIETMMLSRDTYPVARRYGDMVGVSHVLAGIQAGAKPRTVRSVRTYGMNLAMVGDNSVKDCFPVANIGILIGALDDAEQSSDLDRSLADVILLEGHVSPIPWLFRFGRRINRIVSRNFAFAWGYNLVAMIFACAGIIHPLFASLVMVGSSMVIEFHSRLANNV